MDPARDPDQTSRRLAVVDLLTAIRGRAQATRRRIGRVERLSRAHIASDLALIEAAADKLVAALGEPGGGAAPGAKPGNEEAAMDERDREPLVDANEPKGTPPERRLRDGEAGAGDRLGPDLDDPEARPSRNQHSFAGEDSATDTARHYHGPDNPA